MYPSFTTLTSYGRTGNPPIGCNSRIYDGVIKCNYLVNFRYPYGTYSMNTRHCYKVLILNRSCDAMVKAMFRNLEEFGTNSESFVPSLYDLIISDMSYDKIK